MGKIKWAGYVGFGLPLLVLLVAGLVLLLKKDKRSLHGDARFATGADLAKARHVQEDRPEHRGSAAMAASWCAWMASSS